MEKNERQNKGKRDAQKNKSPVQCALRLLSYRGRSRRELAERLRGKGFGPDEIEQTLTRLEGLGYIDDHAHARHLLRWAQEVRRLGRHGALGFLVGKGIPEKLARQAVSDYDETKGAGEILEKKRGAMAGLSAVAKKRRLAGALSRRGYSAETIRKLMKEADHEETEG